MGSSGELWWRAGGGQGEGLELKGHAAKLHARSYSQCSNPLCTNPLGTAAHYEVATDRIGM